MRPYLAVVYLIAVEAVGHLLSHHILPAGERLAAGGAAEVPGVPVPARRLRELLREDDLVTGGTPTQSPPLGVVAAAEHLARPVEVDQVHQQLLRRRENVAS